MRLLTIAVLVLALGLLALALQVQDLMASSPDDPLDCIAEEHCPLFDSIEKPPNPRMIYT